MNSFVKALTKQARTAAAILFLSILPRPEAATLWTGAEITFTESSRTPSDTILAGKVVLTRAGRNVLFNTAAGESSPGASSPADTEWAFGNLTDFASLTFQSLESMRNGDLADLVLNKPMVVHLINEDIYLSLTFTAWGRFGAGGFSYHRSTAPVVQQNVPPTISITSPSDGTTLPAPANVTIAANASDSDGTIAKVEFFDGQTSLGSVTSAPFQSTVTLAPGAHSLTAVATDNQGARTVSSAVTVDVTAPNVPPTVNITNPTDGTTLPASANVTITANASDSDGTIAKVEFFDGQTSLGSLTSAPFQSTVTLAPGAHSLTAVATDNQGASTVSSAVTVNVTAPNVPPTVSITSPTNGATFFVPASITITATASDADGSVAKVEFFDSQTSLGSATSAPFHATVTLAAGSHSLTAVATDNQGTSTTSSTVAVTVNAVAAAPTLSTPSLASDGTFQFTVNGSAGQTYILQASSDLQHWSVVRTIPATNAVFQVTDTPPAGATARFYRLTASNQ